jgi:DNA-binding MarR family transcriptional regulator
MDEHSTELNHFLVKVFNGILHIEEDCLKTEEFKDLSICEIHAIEAVCIADDREMGNRASDIAEALHISAGTLTTEIAQLEKKGCIVRVQDTLDRRIVRLYPTNFGRRANEAHQAFHQKMVSEVMKALSPEEAESLVKAIKKLTEFFSRKEGA